MHLYLHERMHKHFFSNFELNSGGFFLCIISIITFTVL